MLSSLCGCLSSPNSLVLPSLKPLQTFSGGSSMEERDGYFGQGSGRWRSMRDGDFQEQDVWNVLKEREGSISTSTVGKSKEFSCSTSTSRLLPSAARMIPRKSSSNSSLEAKVVQQSAPVKIPDWSKIYGKNSKKASKNVSYDDDDDDGKDSDDDEDEDEDDEYDCMVPPHELLARRLARNQISFSVCEGVGRTLKGRDLSKVRNAVLTKTGFLE